MSFDKELVANLAIRHMETMTKKNVLVSVYTNASGFLWHMMKTDSGTDLGWSEYSGDHEWSGTFTTYEKALQNALDLVDRCTLDEFYKKCPSKEFHWGNYADWIRENCLTEKV